jgi:hypothetical protein
MAKVKPSLYRLAARRRAKGGTESPAEERREMSKTKRGTIPVNKGRKQLRARLGKGVMA